MKGFGDGGHTLGKDVHMRLRMRGRTMDGEMVAERVHTLQEQRLSAAGLQEATESRYAFRQAECVTPRSAGEA